MNATGEHGPPAYLTSIVALALGVVLAVGVSALFGLPAEQHVVDER